MPSRRALLMLAKFRAPPAMAHGTTTTALTALQLWAPSPPPKCAVRAHERNDVTRTMRTMASSSQPAERAATAATPPACGARASDETTMLTTTSHTMDPVYLPAVRAAAATADGRRRRLRHEQWDRRLPSIRQPYERRRRRRSATTAAKTTSAITLQSCHSSLAQVRLDPEVRRSRRCSRRRRTRWIPSTCQPYERRRRQ